MRNRPASLIYVELSSTNGGMMRDLSEEGFALRAMMPLTDGDRTVFSFLLSPLSRIEGEGEVIWTEEKGRVAGIRFIELSSSARTGIQSWLSRSMDNPGPAETPDKPSSPVSSSFEELRDELRPSPDQLVDELRSSLQRPERQDNKPHWVVEPAASAEKAVEPSVQNVWPEGKATRNDRIEESRKDQQRESTRFAETPRVPVAPDTGKSKTVSPPSPATSVCPPQRTESTLPGHSAAAASAGKRMPDISDILMQPPSRSRETAVKAPTLEPLDSWHHGRMISEQGRGSWFTLPRALLIMILLALAVGAYVYREAAGEGLIWLGQQIGGTQTSPPTPAGPAIREEPPAAEAANQAAPSSPTDSTPPASSSEIPASNQETKTPAVSHPKSTPEEARPLAQKNEKPAVTPLSGISSPFPEAPGQEAGLTEYGEALRLLHAKDGTADPAEAVRLLWISVEKGNSNAELTLAELYWRGQGVSRNCDQTRILLSAAARKGNVDAQLRLRQFQREGCE